MQGTQLLPKQINGMNTLGFQALNIPEAETLKFCQNELAWPLEKTILDSERSDTRETVTVLIKIFWAITAIIAGINIDSVYFTNAQSTLHQNSMKNSYATLLSYSKTN